MNGRYVPSLLAAIGEIIEGHMVRTGFLQATDARRATQVDDPAGSGGGGTPTAAAPTGGGDLDGRQLRRRCTRCGMGTMLLQSGCWTCRDCGYSKCG
jgi:ribonucleoside-diphosphate reductase alpha chain